MYKNMSAFSSRGQIDDSSWRGGSGNSLVENFPLEMSSSNCITPVYKNMSIFSWRQINDSLWCGEIRQWRISLFKRSNVGIKEIWSVMRKLISEDKSLHLDKQSSLVKLSEKYWWRLKFELLTDPSPLCIWHDTNRGKKPNRSGR